MKIRFLPITLFLFFNLKLLAQVWEPKAAGTLPSNFSVADISVVNDQVIWATVVDWSAPTPTPGAFVPKLLKSTDGGETWFVKDIEEAVGRICLDIHAFDENTACITTQNFGSGNKRGIFRTTDGGETWTETFNNVAGGVWLHFFDDQEGICINAEFMARTTNGGQSWAIVPGGNIPNFNSNEFTLIWSTSTSLEAIGDIIWFGTNSGRIFKSTDKGQNWLAFDTELGASSEINSVAFTDNSNGLLSYNVPGSGRKIARTMDGGVTWQFVANANNILELTAIPCSRAIMGVSFNNDQTRYTTNLGQTWSQVDAQTDVFAPVFNTPNSGWVAKRSNTGANAALYKWIGGSLNDLIYVNKTASGNNDGKTWADAYTDLKVALDSAAAGDEIWVAEGIYLPGSDPTATFLIDKNLKLYGGFAGSECNLSERDIAQHPTVLSGDVNGDDVVDDFVTNRGDNVMTVVTMTAGVTNETVVDGFTIRNGHADGATFPLANGGGLISTGNPIVKHCTFIQNFAVNLGGAVSFRDASGMTAIFENCLFDHNMSVRGGAADIRFSNLLFSDCTFSNNQAMATLGQTFEENGGAIMTQNANCQFKKCTFNANFCENGGGGFFFWVDANGEGFNLTVDSCNFEGNAAASGGAFYSQTFGENSTNIITNSNFYDNHSTDEFSYGNVVIYHQQSGAYGQATVSNCYFEGNVSNNSTGGLEIGSGPDAAPSTYNISECTFKNNVATNGNGGGMDLWAEVNTDATFNVTGCVFDGNSAATNAGGLWLDSGSDNFIANISHCKFFNNEAPKGSAIGSFKDLVTPATPTLSHAIFENCLIAGNISPQAGISVVDPVNLEFQNCTIANNASSGITYEIGSSLTLQNTILNNPNHIEFQALTNDATFSSHGGNLVRDNSLAGQLIPGDKQGLDPLFMGSGDYHLTANSPCVDAGNPDGVTATTDLNGAARIQGGRVDMGAYESPFVSSAEERIAGEITVSPNPATSVVNIQLPEGVTASPTVQVFDAQGRLVLFSTGQQLDVQVFAAGVYSLRAVVGERVFVGRFVKQ